MMAPTLLAGKRGGRGGGGGEGRGNFKTAPLRWLIYDAMCKAM